MYTAAGTAAATHVKLDESLHGLIQDCRTSNDS